MERGGEERREERRGQDRTGEERRGDETRRDETRRDKTRGEEEERTVHSAQGWGGSRTGLNVELCFANVLYKYK